MNSWPGAQFRVKGVRFRVQDSGFRVKGLGFFEMISDRGRHKTLKEYRGLR